MKPLSQWSAKLFLQSLEGRDLPSFITAPTYSAGSNPRALVVKDFNADGLVDMAVVNRNFSGSVTILTGKADGSFEAGDHFPVGDSPRALVADDLSGDGKPDLAVANSGGNTVSVLLGNGDGTFKPQVTYVAGDKPRAVVAGDFDEDGDLDLVTANYGSGEQGSVTVLTNSGAGAFTSGWSQTFNVEMWDLVAGDFDNDGDNDLAAVGHTFDYDYLLFNPLIQVLSGNGDGTFSAGASYAKDAPSQVLTGDLDSDGDLDLVVQSDNDYLRRVSVWLGNGNGTFNLVNSFGGYYTRFIALGHFDGDGNLDLVTLGGNANVYKGLGDGRFTLTASYIDGGAPGEAAVADLDGDGDHDVIIPNQTSFGTVTVLRNVGGVFYPTPLIFPAGAYLGAVASGDFNQDGWPDIAITNSNWNAHSVTVLINDGDGTFGAPVTYQVVSDPAQIVAADVNLDGAADLVVANRSSGHVSVLVSKGDGTFLPAKNFVTSGLVTSVAVADFTGDGKPDIATNSGKQLAILRGTGSGRFRSPMTYPAGSYPFALAVGDFNADGHLDLAATDVGGTNFPSQLHVLMNNGNGSFNLTTSYDTGNGGGDIVAGDFNGDDAIDLAVANGVGSSTMSILTGNGNGTFQPRVVYPAPFNPGALNQADINNDGKLDLVMSTAGSVAVMFGNGDGSFQTSQQTYFVGSGGALAVADANQDGWVDVMSNQLGVVVLLNAGDWLPGPLPNGRRGPHVPIAASDYAMSPFTTEPLAAAGSTRSAPLSSQAGTRSGADIAANESRSRLLQRSENQVLRNTDPLRPALTTTRSMAPSERVEVVSNDASNPMPSHSVGLVSRLSAIKRLSDMEWESLLRDPLPQFVDW